MGGKCPQTIMTDQCAAMAVAISQVFTTSRHRLCIWHIGENSKKHIKTLRNNKNFMDLFNCLLKYTDTEAEFELYWSRMVIDYKCHKNPWLEKLYDCREKWCPTFNKDYFSGGILSSQRSAACHQDSVFDDGCHLKYHVWRPDKDIIRHEEFCAAIVYAL
ncbi:protein FAR-RED IMPAIRED RESPONSE 1-like [Ipomoea triloba]|uniref:protein FAR-RED IMPAIRED RESPONSE 1-like n=1 Tax=Ipomoea triloba TaxID=35885 RepID=UPI00125E9366|nr:protein FAR-RED IMPAIRED RESPONSE 1-like [Ipomoea triloba]